MFHLETTTRALSFTISSETKHIGQVLWSCGQFLKEAGMNNPSRVTLVLRELLINAIRHGNQGRAACTVRGQVEYGMGLHVVVTVEDEGNGFDYRTLDTTLPDDPRNVHHRGYPLIHALSEHVAFSPKGNSVKVHILSNVGADAQGDGIEGWTEHADSPTTEVLTIGLKPRESASGGPAVRPTAQAGKYLTFGLGNEVYGLEILKVQEIIGVLQVTEVPKTPHYIRGVINLRGKVIPVIELRLKFDLEPKPDSDRTCIIVMQVNREDTAATVGLLVDAVSEVIDIGDEQIESAASLGASMHSDFLLGLGKVGQRVIMLLDAEELVLDDHWDETETVAHTV